MKKFFLLLILMLTIVVSVNAQPRPPRQYPRPSLRGSWILENNQGSEQFVVFTDSTYVLANAIYGGGYSFIHGKYKIDRNKILMTMDGAKETTVLELMWMGPRVRMSDDKIILVYRHQRPGEMFPQEKK